MFQIVVNSRPICLALSGFLDAEFTKHFPLVPSFIPDST